MNLKNILLSLSSNK